jgi:dipeptidyl aminopeptidase/acylaminoacyl peptidase
MAWASAVLARPFTVDDLLRQSSFGAQAVDPSGRWLVFEQRGRYDRARRFDYHFANSQALSRLQVMDLRRPAAARPLLRRDPGPGVVMGPFSPSGRRLAVYRMDGHAWTLGVVTLASGQARWFDITPQDAERGRAIQWLSDSELLVIHRLDRLPPLLARTGWMTSKRLTDAWASAAEGRGSHSVLGSGAYAALRDRGPARLLLRLNVVSGARSELGRGEYFDLEVAPDGRRVALFASGPDVQPRPDGPVRGPAGLDTEETRLELLDLHSGRWTRPCPDCDLLPQLLAWSPDSTALLVFRRGSDGLWTSGAFLRIDARGAGAATVGETLTPQIDLNPVTVRAGWLGGAPLVYARPKGSTDHRLDWRRLGVAQPRNLTEDVARPGSSILAFDQRSMTLLSGERLVRIDDKGHVVDVAGARVAVVAGLRPAASPRLNAQPMAGSWVQMRGPGGGQLAWLDARGLSEVVALPAGAGDVVAASRPYRAAILRRLDARGVEQLLLSRPGADPLSLAAINSYLADTDAPRVEAVHHVGRNGDRLTSWLFLPPKTGARLPPLIVRPYLGSTFASPPRDLYMEQGFFQNLRMLTGHGYAVLVPSLPNPPEGMTEPAQGVADKLLEIENAALADPRLAGSFDPTRRALLGWSFGGYTVMAAITQTNRYRAAVAMDGISDLVGYWAKLAPARKIAPEDGYGGNWSAGVVESTQPKLGAPPWADPERYRRNSPLYFADRIETPLLLIHGGLDPLPAAQSDAMYSALFRQDKDAILVTYWGAHHGVTSPGDVRDMWARTFAFLDARLSFEPSETVLGPSRNPARAPASTSPRLRSRPPKGRLSACRRR